MKLSTDKQYTYNTMINTDDVEKLFSKESATDLKPLFDFYLRTINKLEVQVTALRGNKYKIAITNIDMPLPLDIITDKGTQRMTVTKKGITVSSEVLPQVDPDMYYLKKIIIE
jgi:hypothetical protein